MATTHCIKRVAVRVRASGCVEYPVLSIANCSKRVKVGVRLALGQGPGSGLRCGYIGDAVMVKVRVKVRFGLGSGPVSVKSAPLCQELQQRGWRWG